MSVTIEVHKGNKFFVADVDGRAVRAVKPGDLASKITNLIGTGTGWELSFTQRPPNPISRSDQAEILDKLPQHSL